MTRFGAAFFIEVGLANFEKTDKDVTSSKKAACPEFESNPG
jgi:hypothetical protein